MSQISPSNLEQMFDNSNNSRSKDAAKMKLANAVELIDVDKQMRQF